MYPTETVIINKCQVQYCNKKLSMTDLITCKCKCGNIYCLLHRLAEAHNCTYNYKKDIDVEDYIKKNKCDVHKIIKL